MTNQNPSLNVPTWAKAAAFAVFVGLLFLSVSGNDESNGTSEPDVGIAEHEAWAACKDAVKALLRNPESADFSILSTTIRPTSDGYDIDGTLTASNDFGVESEVAFSCNVWPDGDVEAEISG